MKNTAIVIPTLNEFSSIGALLTVLRENERITRIIVVDDSSTDGTQGVVKEFSKIDPRVMLIERRGPRSFARSYREGFLAALESGADFIIQMDADGSHPTEAIDRMIDGLHVHHAVIGSRFVRGSKTTGRGPARRAISRLGSGFARVVLGANITDMTGGFNGWRADVLRGVLNEEFPYEGFVIQVWLKWRVARLYSWSEIPIHFSERKHGKSKFNMKIFREGIVGVVAMRGKKKLSQ